jgi:transposase
VFNGLRYVVKTGAPWRWMPNDPLPWAAVYQQTQRWLAAGCFKALAEDPAGLRLVAGRKVQPTLLSWTAGPCALRRKAARAGYDGAKRKKGSKLHLAADTLGHLLALHVAPASADERAEVGRLAQMAQASTGQIVDLAYIDQGYTGSKAADAARRMAPPWRSSSCRRPSTALSCCRDAG